MMKFLKIPALLIYTAFLAVSTSARAADGGAEVLLRDAIDASGVAVTNELEFCSRFLLEIAPRAASVPMKNMIVKRGSALRSGPAQLDVVYDLVTLDDGRPGALFFVDFADARLLENVTAASFNLESVVDLFMNAWNFRNAPETKRDQDLGAGWARAVDGTVHAGPFEGRIDENLGHKRIEILLRPIGVKDMNAEVRALLQKIRAYGLL